MTTTTKTTNTNFEMLLQAYESKAVEYYNNRKQATEREFTNSLKELANAITLSVLKKCINVSFSKELSNLRVSIIRDTKNLNKLQHIGESNYTGTYDKNGNYTTVVLDKDLHNDATELMQKHLGSGIDLVQDCIISILTETEKAKDRNGGTLSNAFMTDTYNVRRLKKKVYIQTADSVNGWETVNTTPIQECYKAVRRSIESQKAVKTAVNGYTYIDDLAKDSESNAESVIYRRFGKYADIGGAVVDYNGKETAYTVDRQSAYDNDTLIESLGLTAKQLKVLQLRQSGYGYKAIATYLGITQRAVAKTVKAIQTKALSIGLAPAVNTK